jgi:hypothetical protein
MNDACYCDDLERPSVFEETDVRSARIPHACDECHRAILPGESYRHIWGVWPTIDGAATYRTCARCMALEEWAKAHIPCLCISLGNANEAIAYELDEGGTEMDVLRSEFEALMAEIQAQPTMKTLGVGVVKD